MKSGNLGGGWTLAMVLLAAVVVFSGVIIAVKLGNNTSDTFEITLPPPPAPEGTLYVGGAVNNPGHYPFYAGDSLGDILAAAGGLNEGASLEDVSLLASPPGERDAPQKVDLNRADSWLLRALPGVGETKAQAVIAYREQYGRFRDIHELKKVPGFGEATFQAVEDLITVSGAPAE